MTDGPKTDVPTNDPEFTPEEVEEGKVLAALSYIYVLFFIPLVVQPHNRFCKAHAKQGLVLFIAAMLSYTFSIFIMPPFGGTMLFLLIIVLQIVGLVKALMGEFWKIPGVWDLASRINL
jgi:uncharacterized membrane protein